MKTIKLFFSFLILLVIAFGLSTSASASFDFIYIDDMNATFCSGCSRTSGTYSYGLLVNTGANSIDNQDIDSLVFTSTSSVDGFFLSPFSSQLYLYAPIAPNEVVGSVVTGINDILLDLIQTGESFQNTTPSQVLPFQIGRDSGNTYVGDVYFDITMEMSGEIAAFQTHAYMDVGVHNTEMLSASRISSTPIVPEPISSILFVTGGALLAGRRLISNKIRT